MLPNGKKDFIILQEAQMFRWFYVTLILKIKWQASGLSLHYRQHRIGYGGNKKFLPENQRKIPGERSPVRERLPHTLTPITQISSICSRLPFHWSMVLLRISRCSRMGLSWMDTSRFSNCEYLNFFPFGPPNWSA